MCWRNRPTRSASARDTESISRLVATGILPHATERRVPVAVPHLISDSPQLFIEQFLQNRIRATRALANPGDICSIGRDAC